MILPVPRALRPMIKRIVRTAACAGAFAFAPAAA
jgi:hypothetical protein